MIFTDTQQLFNTPLLSTAVSIAITNNGGIIDVTPTTQRWLHTSLNQLIKDTGNIRIDQLDTQRIYEWHRTTAETATAVTANNYLRAVRIIYNRLLNHGLIASNPTDHIPTLPEPTASPKAITEITYQQLRQATKHTRDKAVIDTLWATGCRLSELLSIQITNCEFWENDNGRCCVAMQVTGKFGKSRYVYGAGEAAQSIYNWYKERPSTNHKHLFISFTGTPLTKSGVYYILKRTRTRACTTQRSNPHSFRHAFAIRKLNAGHDLPTVSAWLGHTDPAFTARVYVIRREDELRDLYFSS